MSAPQTFVGQDFEAWLVKSAERIRASLRSFAGVVDVEAVVQESALRMWNLWPVESDGRPEPALRLAITIGRNLARNAIRDTRREVPLEPDAEATLAASVREPGDPFLRKQILRCLARLPSRARATVQARIASGGGDSDATLAKRIGMSHAAFRQNLVRGRRLLEDCLGRAGINLREVLPVKKRETSPTELLMNDATTAWRPRTPDGAILPHPAWADLAPADRELLYEETRTLRCMESALDPRGHTSTVRAVLSRIGGA